MRGAGVIRRLVLTAMLAAIVAMVMVPRLRAGIEYRSMRTALFDSGSPEHRSAVGYFSARLDPGDPLSTMRFFLIEGLEARVLGLGGADLRSLHGAFGGTREFVQRFPDAHLRAISLKLEDSGGVPFARYALTQASRTSGADDELARAIFDRLCEHESATVRRETIEHACWRFGPAALAYVEAGMRDESPEVARTSWLMLPHLDPPGGYSANYLDIHADVGEAVLLAATLLGAEEAGALIDRAERSANPALAEAVVYCRALLDEPGDVAPLASVDGFAGQSLDALREQEQRIADLHQRALIRLAITARQPTPSGVDEALLLVRDGLLEPRELLGALLHAGEARAVMRVLLSSGDDARTIRGDQGGILRKYFSEKYFLLPVPGQIPDSVRSRALAFDSLRAWWMCIGNRAAFDTLTRSYTIETTQD